MTKGVDKCSIENCDGVEFGRTWCSKHYRRWLRHGDPMIVKKRGNPTFVKKEQESDSRDGQRQNGRSD